MIVLHLSVLLADIVKLDQEVVGVPVKNKVCCSQKLRDLLVDPFHELEFALDAPLLEL